MAKQHGRPHPIGFESRRLTAMVLLQWRLCSGGRCSTVVRNWVSAVVPVSFLCLGSLSWSWCCGSWSFIFACLGLRGGFYIAIFCDFFRLLLWPSYSAMCALFIVVVARWLVSDVSVGQRLVKTEGSSWWFAKKVKVCMICMVLSCQCWPPGASCLCIVFRVLFLVFCVFSHCV